MTRPDPAAVPRAEGSGPVEDEAFLDLLRSCLAEFRAGPGAMPPGEAESPRRDPSPSASGEVRVPDAIASGRFEWVRLLGRGSFGVVCLARDRLLGRLVAIKFPHAELVAAPETRDRFAREARALAALDHPHIVPIYEAADRGAACYIVSAFLDGPSLAEWLGRSRGPVPWPAAARLVARLADAAAHAHGRGLIHRDIKPSNILLDRDGDDLDAIQPRLVDFNLACLVTEVGRLTLSGVPLGSPPYMPPEQALGDHGRVGPAADIYALGATLYEILAGRPPFAAPSFLETLRRVIDDEPPPLRSIRPDLPRDLATIVHRCLQKDPADRYPTAEALRDDLDRLRDGRAIAARRVGRAERLARWCRRPERLRDAGLPLLVLGTLLTTTSLLSILAIAVGIIRPPRPFEALVEAAEALTWFDAPIAVAGALILRRNSVGPWLGLLCSLGFLASVTYSLTVRPFFTFGGIFDGDSPRSIFDGLHFLIASLAVALSTLAVLASRAEARRRAPRPAPQGGGGVGPAA